MSIVWKTSVNVIDAYFQFKKINEETRRDGHTGPLIKLN